MKSSSLGVLMLNAQRKFTARKKYEMFIFMRFHDYFFKFYIKTRTTVSKLSTFILCDVMIYA